jgi:hypothetical protein
MNPKRLVSFMSSRFFFENLNQENVLQAKIITTSKFKLTAAATTKLTSVVSVSIHLIN